MSTDTNKATRTVNAALVCYVHQGPRWRADPVSSGSVYSLIMVVVHAALLHVFGADNPITESSDSHCVRMILSISPYPTIH